MFGFRNFLREIQSITFFCKTNPTSCTGQSSNQTLEDDLGQSVFFKVLRRKRRNNKRLVDNLIGIWFPVYIPQAETAYNYKETR